MGKTGKTKKQRQAQIFQMSPFEPCHVKLGFIVRTFLVRGQNHGFSPLVWSSFPFVWGERYSLNKAFRTVLQADSKADVCPHFLSVQPRRRLA